MARRSSPSPSLSYSDTYHVTASGAAVKDRVEWALQFIKRDLSQAEKGNRSISR